ncbi:OmpA family protein [Treponema primitia]|uniref:OmpA family protein n=1 Tax=Treponema primitia TaxID=88058 RepID=UPI00397F3183
MTLLLIPLLPVSPQEAGAAVRLSQGTQGPYSIVERSDWSRYDNGKYIGHVYREVRASIIPQNRGGTGYQYRGNFFVMEETLRDMRQSARAVDDVIPVSFRVEGEKGLVIDNDRGFPAFRNFPAFPPDAIRPGEKWVARGKRAVDPLNEGKPVVVPLIAEYEYRGIEDYRNIPVHRIFAKYASRYEGSNSFEGSSQTQDFRLEGTHNVDILLRVSDGIPLMMRDNLDETYSWPRGSARGGDSGSTIRFRGFTLTFGDGLVPLDREALITAVTAKERARPADSGGDRTVAPGDNRTTDSGTNKTTDSGGGRTTDSGGDRITESGIDMAAVPEGVKLTIKDIRFQPDSDEMLPAERPRLDMIARVLKETPDRMFLVEGHTAAIGRPTGEMELSVQRARRMVNELTSRGIPAERFIYKGWGGTKPIGDNSNDEGRRLNRRVEITILE